MSHENDLVNCFFAPVRFAIPRRSWKAGLIAELRDNELEKNPPRTKVQTVHTNEVADGTRVQVNDKETFTIDREEGVIKDGITAEIPEEGMTLYGKKILPPDESGGEGSDFLADVLADEARADSPPIKENPPNPNTRFGIAPTESHETSRQELRKGKFKLGGVEGTTEFNVTIMPNGEEWDRYRVRNAIRRNEPIPDEVLADFYSEVGKDENLRERANQVIHKWEKINPSVDEIWKRLTEEAKSAGVDYSGESYQSQGGSRYMAVYRDGKRLQIRVSGHGVGLGGVDYERSIATNSRPSEVQRKIDDAIHTIRLADKFNQPGTPTEFSVRPEEPKYSGRESHPGDVGMIDEDAAKAIGIRAGGIRLESDSIPHMETPERLARLKRAGFNSARDAVNYVTSGYQRIYKTKGDSLLLARRNGKDMVTFVQLIPDKNEHYYRINTVLPVRDGYLKNKPLLWERAPTSQTLASPPNAVSGQSKGFDRIVDPSAPSVKENPTNLNTKFSVAPVIGVGGVPSLQSSAAKPGIGDRIRGVLDSEPVQAARRKLEDEFLPVRRAVAAIKKAGGIIDDQNDVGMKLDLFHGKVAEKYRDVERTAVQPIIDTMSRANLTRAQVDRYLMALHAPERNATIAARNPDMPDGGSGMKIADANRIVAEVQRSGQRAAYEKIAVGQSMAKLIGDNPNPDFWEIDLKPPTVKDVDKNTGLVVERLDPLDPRYKPADNVVIASECEATAGAVPTVAGRVAPGSGWS